MCSFFGLPMENYQGDLTDILRSSSGNSSSGINTNFNNNNSNLQASSTWQFPSSDPLNFSFTSDDHRDFFFGDPFTAVRDPLLHELNMAGSGGYYSSAPNSVELMSTTASTIVDETGTSSSPSYPQRVFEDDFKSPCNIFSRIQISQSPKQLPVSPCDSPVLAAAAAASPRGIKAPAMLPSDMINATTSKNCLLDNTSGPLQISSPRNLGIKRRKSQAKKVVCIPAPAAANSRSSGEVVPSDLWAWRKYGQKPIKGSPYPRGYYRCSSSKGCSARKQVERSRTDPNMLVITYTSEHNHPWPTQRNALAGSTRAQPSKNTAAKTSASSSSQPQTNTKEEVKENSNDDTMSPVIAASSSASVKEEMEEMEKPLEMDQDCEFNEGFSQIYKPALMDQSNQCHEDFFADLGEIEADPLKILFSHGFSGDVQKENKGLDPFNLFDWSEDNNNNSTSFGESKRGL
ncbi:probable WRKY transcription factor 14 [Mangifera indica]|uniref:probable WRKY transcription factor 14 n=1 Tax=Mangifera indica TaxID=29780 RepID=UPI001CFAD097|nr:probable WRKY transcription factor 14 [Mangifera indica]XP_044495779.1 probable WRKY transcription factor 14 [Mangifera indica]